MRQCLGKAVNTRFGRRVIHLAILPGLPVDRSDIDDPAPFAIPHPRKHTLCHVEAATQIGVDHFFPCLIGQLHDRAVTGNAGIVDQHINRAKRVSDGGATGLAGIVICHIPFEGRNPGAFGKFLGARIVAGIICSNGQPAIAQRDADRLTNPARSPGYDCDACHIISPMLFLSRDFRTGFATLQVRG